MKKICITGNIASGKSTVEKFIEKLGYSIIDADKICHFAFENDVDIKNKIQELFKSFKITDESGKINRKIIGEIVFSNPQYKKSLENIIHPFVKKEINNFIEKHNNENLVFISVPLLFEAGMENMFDEIILVTANENTRLNRLMTRNNFTKEQSALRIKAQMPQEDKIKLATFVIDNNSDLLNLEINTKKVLQLLD